MKAEKTGRFSTESVSQDEARKAGILARNSLTKDAVCRFSEKICSRIIESEDFLNASVIMVYRAVGNEVSLSLLEKYVRTAADDKILVYPYCVPGNERRMLSLKPKDPECFRPGLMKIPEPVYEISEEIAPGDIDLVICPGAAFDENMSRVGMGAGYYDRFLKKCLKAVIGMAAFECQKQVRIVTQEWDVPMKRIWTEERTRN